MIRPNAESENVSAHCKNDKIVYRMKDEFLMHKDKKEKRKRYAHSGTFVCLNARATASQSLEPSFF